MRTKYFGHEELKHPFSHVEGDSNLQKKILKLTPLPQKIATRKQAIIITMKE
jgi:hypothetical protein